jgi:hypothetical protein
MTANTGSIPCIIETGIAADMPALQEIRFDPIFTKLRKAFRASLEPVLVGCIVILMNSIAEELVQVGLVRHPLIIICHTCFSYNQGSFRRKKYFGNIDRPHNRKLYLLWKASVHSPSGGSITNSIKSTKILQPTGKSSSRAKTIGTSGLRHRYPSPYSDRHTFPFHPLQDDRQVLQ